YKFETGTGFEIRPVISPDGQSVVFRFNYMYTTQIREPVRADEKHLGRIKRHFIDTDVQLGNYELREISRYVVALKAARTSRGVPLLQDIPGVGILFRPLPSAESALQENIILGQATIFPTLFDLMGLRWAPAIADIDPLREINSKFAVDGRRLDVQQRAFDTSTSHVDDALRIPPGERRTDLYRRQETIPFQHPNGYQGPGLNLKSSTLQENYNPTNIFPSDRFNPPESKEGSQWRNAPPPGTRYPNVAPPPPDTRNPTAEPPSLNPELLPPPARDNDPPRSADPLPPPNSPPPPGSSPTNPTQLNMPRPIPATPMSRTTVTPTVPPAAVAPPLPRSYQAAPPPVPTN